jgi:acetylornithine deacetylase
MGARSNTDSEVTENLTRSAIEILRSLISFDSTSSNSNLPLIEFVEEYLSSIGVPATKIISTCGKKANLVGSVGPQCSDGVILSGHTDVVPVAGQVWASEPFTLERRDQRLFGRGTADMKGFIACALAAIPVLSAHGCLRRPLHLALSYDEETGCLGAPSMIEWIAASLPRPAAVIVGEPTGMAVVSSHKGVRLYRIAVKGHEAHSSLAHLGVSANMVAAKLMKQLVEIADELESNADAHSSFVPAFSTLSIGQIHGGTAANILAGECWFDFDLRCLPNVDPDVILGPFLEKVMQTDIEVRQRFSDCVVEMTLLADVPPLAADGPEYAGRLARHLTGDNATGRVVPYCSEAGQFQATGFPTVICGPGYIEQAHQADEYIEIGQLEQCLEFMMRLGDHLSVEPEPDIDWH